MRRRARILAAVAALTLALGPAIAEARPGGGSSSGSRGSRTYSAPPSTNTAPSGGTRFDRTETPNTPANPGYGAPRPAPTYTPQAANRGGMFGGGFMAGLAGGLLGAGIAGMLFGGGAFGGLSGLSGFLGFLLQIGLIAGLVYLIVRLVRGRRAAEPALAGAGGRMPPVGPAAGNAYAREMAGEGRSGAAQAATRALQLDATDFASFEHALVQMNAAWSRQDMDTLRRISTPEMARYFEGDLRDLAARGWKNETRDVRLESGDLSEAWAEGGLEYATVAMRFSLIDVTRDSIGQVVEGNPDTRQTATELWTFVRQPGRAWTLSAIQQTGR
ncbi:Tim44 domain-containing protein [Muricoccus radiodurans]|uniref:Tim44 domain-containing protein n=1 Tax=Muricoccus radiodurans TaxID=2231721 RepID=UPI003CF371F2